MNDSFLTYVTEQFSILGHIRIRKMFGGAGIYLDDLMFGLIADDCIYLKVDDSNKSDYEQKGLEPFLYEAKGKAITMSYYQIPEEFLEDRDELQIWGQKAVTAARNSATKKKKRKKA